MSTSGNALQGTRHAGRTSGPAPHVRTAAHYALAAVGCVAFNAIYALFAHGVSSGFMTFMFAIPLLMGAVPALVLFLMRRPAVAVASRRAWALTVACLTVASCLHGVFDIAGTASPYLAVYVMAAVTFAGVAVAMEHRRRHVWRASRVRAADVASARHGAR